MNKKYIVRLSEKERIIEAVSPDYVIFSAGHKYEHPRDSTVKRYIRAGVARKNIFRTDRGDNEGGKEWPALHPGIASDKAGDNDVDILIRPSGPPIVEYMGQ